MRILTFRRDGDSRPGALLSGDRVLDLSALAPDTLALADGGEALLAAAREAVAAAEDDHPCGEIHPLSEVTLEAPIPGCRKLFCLAGNYREHIKEGGRPTYEKDETYPYFFMKPPTTTLIGTGAALIHPRIGRKMDYEGEFVIVIGRRGKHIPVEDAESYVLGYTVLNDFSERSLDSKAPPKAEREMNRFFDWLVGKWCDSSAPCGPWIVTRDDIADPHALSLRTTVNGEIRQDSSTAEMIFTVPEIVAFISRVVTLEPGDMIATGTPGGVGSARGVFLQPGDTVDVEIEGIGRISNTLIAEP